MIQKNYKGEFIHTIYQILVEHFLCIIVGTGITGENKKAPALIELPF